MNSRSTITHRSVPDHRGDAMFSSVRRRAAVLFLALAMPVALAACAAPGGDNTNNQSNAGPIKIALVDAQSGQLSSLGAWELKGARLAIDEWNAAGVRRTAKDHPISTRVPTATSSSTLPWLQPARTW